MVGCQRGSIMRRLGELSAKREFIMEYLDCSTWAYKKQPYRTTHVIIGRYSFSVEVFSWKDPFKLSRLSGRKRPQWPAYGPSRKKVLVSSKMVAVARCFTKRYNNERLKWTGQTSTCFKSMPWWFDDIWCNFNSKFIQTTTCRQWSKNSKYGWNQKMPISQSLGVVSWTDKQPCSS